MSVGGPLFYFALLGGPLVNITTATYCITAQGGTIGGHYHGHLLYCSQGGTIGEHYRSHLLYRSPKGGPLVDITAATYCIAAQRGGPLWTLPQPLTVSQPKGGPLVDITAATYCIAAQGGTSGGHYRSHLLYRSPKGGPLVDITAATYCIYRSPKGGPLWTLPQPLTVSQHKGGPLVDITAATYCIAAKGGPLVNITAATSCIAAQRGDHWWTLRYSQLDFCITAPRPRGDHCYSGNLVCAHSSTILTNCESSELVYSRAHLLCPPG